MAKIRFIGVLFLAFSSPFVNAQGIRRIKAAKSDDSSPDIQRVNINENEFGIGTPSDLMTNFRLSAQRRRSGKSGKSSKGSSMSSKSEKAPTASRSVFRSVVSEFCDALTDCGSAISKL